MNYRKISLAALFLMASQQMIFSQVTKTDSTKTKAEKVIEGVQLRGNTNKKSESAILGEQRKAIVQKQSIGAEEISRKEKFPPQYIVFHTKIHLEQADTFCSFGQ